MNTLQTIQPDEYSILRDQASVLVTTGFLPQAIKTPEQALAIILTGRELGIPTMASLNTINVIQGKPTISPQLMLALIERSGQLEDIQIEIGSEVVAVSMKRKGRTQHTEIFGFNEAKAMGLWGKENYKKQPLVMCKWRCVAACARTVFPDVILGLYTPEEMGAEVTITDDGQVVVSDDPASNVGQWTPREARAVVEESERSAQIKRIGQLFREFNKEAGDSVWNKETVEAHLQDQYLTSDINDLLDDQLDDLEAFIKTEIATMLATDSDDQDDDTACLPAHIVWADDAKVVAD